MSAVAGWPVSLVVVVIGAAEDEVLEAVDFGDAVVAVNPEWEEGIASSIRVGLDVLSRDRRIDAAFIALGDQPHIPSEVPGALIAALEDSGRQAAVPKYRYERANPVLIHRSLWPRLMSLEGDSGAARLLQTHPEWVEEVWIDHTPPIDVDTRDDVADLEGR